MANTVIQLKFSNATATPTTLNVAEPAYSYTSNTLFIGSPAGTGSIAIGGKFYLDQQQEIYNTANAAFTAANTSTTWQIQNVQVKCDIVSLDSGLNENLHQATRSRPEAHAELQHLHLLIPINY